MWGKLLTFHVSIPNADSSGPLIVCSEHYYWRTALTVLHFHSASMALSDKGHSGSSFVDTSDRQGASTPLDLVHHHQTVTVAIARHD